MSISPKNSIDASEIRSFLRYVKKTGLFYWKNHRDNSKNGCIAGNAFVDEDYVYIKILGRSYLAHRLAWAWVTGSWPIDQIDHRDGDKSNNRWNNLREASGHGEQQQNQKLHKNNNSGYEGVAFCKRSLKWRSRITFRGKDYSRRFDTLEEAVEARAVAKKRLHIFQPVSRVIHWSPFVVASD